MNRPGSDGHHSQYPSTFLTQHREPQREAFRRGNIKKVQKWDKEIAVHPPTVLHQCVVDDGPGEMLMNIVCAAYTV